MRGVGSTGLALLAFLTGATPEPPAQVVGTFCRRVRASLARSAATAEKALPIGLGAVPAADDEGSAPQRRIGARLELLQVGVVRLQRRAVLPALAEYRGPGEHGRGVPQPANHRGHTVQVTGAGRGVHRALDLVGDEHVAVGGEGLAGEAQVPVAQTAGGKGRNGARALVPSRGLDREGAVVAPAERLDHAPQCRAAVELGGPALHDLHPVEGHPGDAAPIDPAPEGVVQRHAVEEHEGPAGPARPHAPQRRSLGGGVGDAAAGTAEEGEPRHLSQGIVDGQGGCGLEPLAFQDQGARGSVEEA